MKKRIVKMSKIWKKILKKNNPNWTSFKKISLLDKFWLDIKGVKSKRKYIKSFKIPKSKNLILAEQLYKSKPTESNARWIQKLKNKRAYEERVRCRRVRSFKQLIYFNKFRKAFRYKFKYKKPGKWKLKKKWRFWRLYKRFFLFDKNKKLFTRLRWIFNQKRILFYQLSYVYGDKIFKQRINRQKKRRSIFNGIFFFKVLYLLEFKLSVFIFRLYFSKSIKNSIILIKNNLITVNNKMKSKNYVVKPSDLIQKKKFVKTVNEYQKWKLFYWRKYSLYRRVKRLWYRSPWRTFNKKSRKNFKFYNILEINDKIDAVIVLRNLKFDEFQLQNKCNKKFMLKKIYRFF